MSEKTDKHILKNGMVILGEPMEAVESVAFRFMLPAGAAKLPQDCCGASNVISDWIFRGAGDKNSRELSDALDGLGLHRAEAVSSSHITIGAALESENLAEAVELYAEVILRAKLEDKQFELARQLAIHGILAMDDDPRQKVMLKLKEHFYPNPLGRSTLGEIKEIESLTSQKTRDIIKQNFNLSEAILAVAGKYDFDIICKQVERLFEGNLQDKTEEIPIDSKTSKYTHIDSDGAQVHIGLMTATVRPEDEDYYNARVAISILSGGMSARLFTEVREKRGLCYAIGAKYHGLKEAAGICCYAGTTPDKAQETLEVVMKEFRRLKEGISNDEIERAKTGLKSSLILQSESSSSRASGIGSDYYMLARVRSLEEIKEKIEAVNIDSVLNFLQRNNFEEFTVITIGPKKIQF